ncbi:MAG: hypothetical protein MRQ09_03075 [Candidatus Midichloria sp.]|nr:hypothetical protein [Candidatus Midichloria sp.]
MEKASGGLMFTSLFGMIITIIIVISGFFLAILKTVIIYILHNYYGHIIDRFTDIFAIVNRR